MNIEEFTEKAYVLKAEYIKLAEDFEKETGVKIKKLTWVLALNKKEKNDNKDIVNF